MHNNKARAYKELFKWDNVMSAASELAVQHSKHHTRALEWRGGGSLANQQDDIAG